MKKCSCCGRMYSDMVTVCPSCKVSLDGSSGSGSPRPVQPAQPVQPVQQYQPAQPAQPVQQYQPAQPVQQNQPAQPAKAEGSGIGWGILSFFIPLVGLILYCRWKNTKPRAAKAASIGAAIGFAVNVAMGAAGL